MTDHHFYSFLKHKQLALVANELEQSVYTSPRTMLTHARVLVESVLKLVMREERMQDQPYMTLKDRLDEVDRQGLLIHEVKDALELIRRSGNLAAHETRGFRASEALKSWEAIYIVLKWYTEVYGDPSFEFPEYRDPSPPAQQSFELPELEARLERLESLLRLQVGGADETTGAEAEAEAAVAVEEETPPEPPGYTTVRRIRYRGRSLDIPYFLRDAFLLPQRFEKSVRFLVKLGGAEEARIMSELPADLDGLHHAVTRYNEKHDEQLFDELGEFIAEEKARRKIRLDRPGELFLFHRADWVTVTESLAGAELTKENFPSLTPGFTRQLHESGIRRAGQLPQELVILAKYKNVGTGSIEKLFEDLKERQKARTSD